MIISSTLKENSALLEDLAEEDFGRGQDRG